MKGKFVENTLRTTSETKLQQLIIYWWRSSSLKALQVLAIFVAKISTKRCSPPRKAISNWEAIAQTVGTSRRIKKLYSSNRKSILFWICEEWTIRQLLNPTKLIKSTKGLTKQSFERKETASRKWSQTTTKMVWRKSLLIIRSIGTGRPMGLLLGNQ